MCLDGVKTTKEELMITGISAEIRSRHLPNTGITTSATSIGNSCSARLLVSLEAKIETTLRPLRHTRMWVGMLCSATAYETIESYSTLYSLYAAQQGSR